MTTDKRLPTLARLAAGLPLLAILACGGGDSTGPGGGNGGTTVPTNPTLSLDVQPIFTASCALAGCHAGTAPAQGQDLSAGNTFGNTVDIPSEQLPSMNRITPGDPTQSYLVHKIEGTQTSVGGTGSRMPFGRAALSSTQIATITAWITSGAPNN